MTGSTGLIGSALVTVLSDRGHEPVRVIRRADPGDTTTIGWDPETGRIDAAGFESIDAVVHLAGEGIARRRWTDAQKAKIEQSRVRGTELVATTLAALADGPRVLVSGSAIGFYGDRDDERLDERSEAGSGFLADVCRRWEGAAAPARAAGLRVVHPRTGMVLASEGGALAEQLPFFRLGLGGRIGSGRQWVSWISIHDQVAAIVWLLDADVEGPVNLTAPRPVTNLGLTKTLGRVLRRPTLLPIPRPALWARLGRELTTSLLYASTRVEPSVLSTGGFRFAHPDVESALRAVLHRPL